MKLLLCQGEFYELLLLACDELFLVRLKDPYGGFVVAEDTVVFAGEVAF